MNSHGYEMQIGSKVAFLKFSFRDEAVSLITMIALYSPAPLGSFVLME